MDGTRLVDRIAWGNNIVARAVGSPTDAYRPSGATDPLAATNRFLRLPAAFTNADGKFDNPTRYGDALWRGLFDNAYTRVGDYLVQDHAIWFIASQSKLLPVLCVRTNRWVSINRPTGQASAGTNSYGGVTQSNVTPLMSNWPAAVLTASREGRPLAGLPSDNNVAYWSVLVPACAGVILRPADMMADDLGRNATVSAAELTELGWRLTVKQATT